MTVKTHQVAHHTKRTKIPAQFLICFISAIIWGLLAHGMTLFNKYSLHEDPSQLYGVGATFISGRWMLDILHRFEVFFLGGSYSLPLLNGIISICYIALGIWLITDLLEIRKPLLCILISGVMITTPSLTGTFGYMFTAPHYMLGYLFAIGGTYLICKYRKWYTFPIGVLLIASAVGIYQATVSVALCLMLIYFIHTVSRCKKTDWRTYLLSILYYVFACIAFILIYAAINAVYLSAMNAQLLDYQNISSAGKLPLRVYIANTLQAIKEFINPTANSSAFMYPFGMIWLYRLGFIVAVILLICFLWNMKKQGPKKIIQVLLPLCAFPIAVNFIYVMCGNEFIHSLMVYAHTMSFILIAWLICQLWEVRLRICKTFCIAACCLALLFPALYVRFDNICYLKAEIVQQQCFRYYTTLATRIQSTAGYQSHMPVAYINFYSKQDSTLKINAELDGVNIIPYQGTSDMINNFAAISFFENWCGFAPIRDHSGYQSLPEVQNMPCYPDDGSIRIIDGVVVVKFK